MKITIKHKRTLAILFTGDTADLSGANLRGADLREADLSGANLREADLSGANLRGAKVKTNQKDELLKSLGIQVQE